MRFVNAAAQAARERRRYLNEIPMVYIEARDRDSGQIHGIGLWKGPQIEDIVVPDFRTGFDVVHTFYNQGLLDVGDVRYESGLSIRPITLRLSAINDAVLVAFRLYEARGAIVQMWRRAYDHNWKPLGVEQWDYGMINLAPSERPAQGSESSIEVEMVSEVRMLTEGSNLRKSHQAQRRRGDDDFRQYKATTADWTVPWGSKDIRVKKGASGGGTAKTTGQFE
jgi:hypothetical protein